MTADSLMTVLFLVGMVIGMAVGGTLNLKLIVGTIATYGAFCWLLAWWLL